MTRENLFTICFIDFAHEYGEIIEKLTERGDALRENNLEKVGELNLEILEFK